MAWIETKQEVRNMMFEVGKMSILPDIAEVICLECEIESMNCPSQHGTLEYIPLPISQERTWKQIIH